MTNMSRRRRRWQRINRYLWRTRYRLSGPVGTGSTAVWRMWREQSEERMRKSSQVS